MTQKEKDILMERMLDPEATLTDAELRLILSDDELREIHEVSAAVRGACVQPSVIDIEQEWKLFRHRLYPRPARWRWVMRVAAIFLGVLFVSGIVRYALDSVLTDEKPDVVAESKQSAMNEVGEASDRKKEQEAELIPVVEEAPAVSGRKVRHEIPVQVKVEEEEEDIDEYLRIEQARIDNDIALLQAQLYIEEIQALSSPLSPETVDEDINPQEVRYIIMQ